MNTSASHSQEAADARTVDQAIGMIHSRLHREAIHALREVTERTPTKYQRIEAEDDGLNIRFWDQEEFLAYVAYHRGRPTEQSIRWIPAAYPRAWFFLGFIYVHLRESTRALDALNRGLALEPDQPRLLCEKGQVLATLRDFSSALELYRRAETGRPETSPLQRAMALRGQGFQLIELGDLEAAEECFNRSLELDPKSELARDELKYIAHLRSGGSAAPAAQTVTLPGQGTLCTVCGQPVQDGRMMELQGRPQFVCTRCAARNN